MATLRFSGHCMVLVNFLKRFAGIQECLFFHLLLPFVFSTCCVFARLCAVFGGIYVLRRKIDKAIVDANNKFVCPNVGKHCG